MRKIQVALDNMERSLFHAVENCEVDDVIGIIYVTGVTHYWHFVGIDKDTGNLKAFYNGCSKVTSNNRAGAFHKDREDIAAVFHYKEK